MATPLIINRRFIIQDQLGAGGMGVVYRAQDRLTNNAIALKQVTVAPEHLDLTTSSSSPDYRLVLAHEFRVLASLRHPHIISVLDFGFDSERQPYFTMDLLEDGQTILAAAKSQRLEVRYAYILQILQALAYLFRRKILHRDLKPGNVLVKDNQVKVLDFGLAVARGQKIEAAGTFAYLAPEILQGHAPSEASDLYAVGLMAYELITGHYPYRKDSLLNAILLETPDFTEIAPELRYILMRLLAKDPDERYSDAAELIADYSEATGQTYNTSSLHESFLQAAQFVGRDVELNGLTDALAQALKGSGSAWLIGGESGVGKSRLLDELYIQALVDGALALRGQASAESGTPYLPFREPLRALCLLVDLTDLEAGVLKPICPDIEALLGRAIPDAPDLEPKAAQERLFTVISDVFSRQSQPLVLILEDLQWAGNESLALLKHLLLDQGPRLIAASYRDDELPTLANDLSAMTKLSLARLTRNSIAELSESMLGKAGKDSSVINLLERETEGNVFFMVEVIRALAEEAGNLERVGQMTLPATVFAGGIRQVVQRRLAQVPDSARPLLNLAASAGRLLELPVLQALDPALNLEEWLDTCADASVLAVQDGTWRFAHDKLRDGLLANLPQADRQRLHQQIAQAIEVLYPNVAEKAGNLAYHWREANDPVAELPYNVAAGDYAYRLNNPLDAINFYNRALELAQVVSTSAEQLAYLYTQRGRSYELSGQYRLARDNYAEFLAYAESQQNPQLRLNALIMLANLHILPNPEHNPTLGNQLIQEALVLANELDDQAAKAKIYWMRMNSIAFGGGDAEEGIRYGLQGEAIAREHGLREQLAFILQDIFFPYFTLGDYDMGFKSVLEARPIWEELGNLPLLSDTLSRLGRCYYFQGDYEAAIRTHDQALQVARDCGNRWAMANSRFIGGYSAYSDWGEIDTAIDILSESIAWAEQSQHMIGLVCNAELGWLYATLGQVQIGSDYIQKSFEISKRVRVTMPWSAGLMARLHILKNDLASAEAVLVEGHSAYRSNPILPNRVYLAMADAELALAKKQDSVAVDVLDSLLTFFTKARALAYRPETLYLKSIALQNLGKTDDARASLQEAYQIAQQLKLRRVLWKIQLALYRLDSKRQWLDQAKEQLQFIAAHIADAKLRASFLALPDVQFILS